MKKFLSLLACVFCATPLMAQKNEASPTAGQQFVLQNKVPKYVTCDLELRDPGDKFWPNFYYGRPLDGGLYSFDPAAPQAKFTVVFDQMTQPAGEQNRKVLGELCTPGKFPVITFVVNGMKPFQTETVEVEQKGKKSQKTTTVSELDAVLQIGDKSYNLKPKATFAYHKGKDAKPESAPEAVTINARLDLKGADLGLNKYGADTPLSLGITVFASAQK